MERCTDFETLLPAVRKVATEVAARHAADVDAQARFPTETLAALREVGALAAAVPREFGGAGLNLLQLARLCAALGQGCGSSAMVLAMHTIQVGCIARHVNGSGFFTDYLGHIAQAQPLLASMTSEVGTFGETRTSICAVQREGERFRLDKDATTGSYCAQGQGILVTCRRDADAPQGDQVLVLVREGDYTLEQTTTWDTLGMRGTSSPGFKLQSQGSVQQILPAPYADISAQTMVPFSHILWSGLWWGIAADAHAKAAAFVRGDARKRPGTVPPTALLLAELSKQMQLTRMHWQGLAEEFDRASPQDLLTMGWALKMNNLKAAASESTPQMVHRALQIVGILGYKNDTPFSLGRQYRDALSGSLMVSNERIAAKTASMLLVFKDD